MYFELLFYFLFFQHKKERVLSITNTKPKQDAKLLVFSVAQMTACKHWQSLSE